MKLLEVEILTHDLDKTEKFYSEILELKPEYKYSDRILFKLGESRLIFHKSDIKTPLYHFAFSIPNNQMEEAIRWMNKKKVQLLPIYDTSTYIAEFERWNARSVYFFDNNKNLCELIARFDLSNESNVKFGGYSILSINEVGIVSDDVLKEVEYVIKEYGVKTFRGFPIHKDFVALGDERGVLLFISNQVKWYPAKKLSPGYPLRVRIENEGQIFEYSV